MSHRLPPSQAQARKPFSQCLVEVDESVFSRAPSGRIKALIASLLFEIILLAAVVAVPLVATSERLKPYHIVLAPPYRGSVHSITQQRPPNGGTHTNPAVPWFLCQPLKIPTRLGERRGGQPLEDGGPGTTLEGIPGGPLSPVENRATDFAWLTPPLPSPPPIQHPQEPLKRSEGVQQALLVNRVEPIYPVLARLAHMEGAVRLRALIGRDGSVSALEVLSGSPIFAEAARAAVAQWRYRPTRLNGDPVEVETYVTVVFQFER